MFIYWFEFWLESLKMLLESSRLLINRNEVGVKISGMHMCIDLSNVFYLFYYNCFYINTLIQLKTVTMLNIVMYFSLSIELENNNFIILYF